MSNTFNVLSEEDPSTNEVDAPAVSEIESKLQSIDFSNVDNNGFQTVNRNKRKSPKVELCNFDKNESAETADETSFSLSNIGDDVSHYLKLANEVIHCLHKKALDTIRDRMEKLMPGVYSMNILGPIYRNSFYVRLDDKAYALYVNESVVRSGKMVLDGKQYDIKPSNSIRIWDVLCGPSDQPLLFKKHNMLSLGEKLQKVIQEKVYNDKLNEGKISKDEPYSPTVWLYLAFRGKYRDSNEPCVFVNMSWNTDDNNTNKLTKVADYYIRNKSRSNVPPARGAFRGSHRGRGRGRGRDELRVTKFNNEQ